MVSTGRVIGNISHSTNHSLRGVSRNGVAWIARIECNGREFVIGEFEDRDDAAYAYDMESIRAHGTDSELNFSYEVMEESSEYIKVKDRHGLQTYVDIVPDKQSYLPLRAPPVQISRGAFDILKSSPLSTDGAPPRASITRAWNKRIQSSYTPSSSFCYEITFPHQNSLGLNLKPRSIYYSCGGGTKHMGALVVVDATSLLSTIVYPGDIILRINDMNLTDIGESFSFDTCTSRITSTKPPRCVRFLRPLGPYHTLSAAELGVSLGLSPNYLASGKSISNPTETLPAPPTPVAKFNVVVNHAGSTQSLQLVYVDSQAPVAVKRLMQGMKVSWEDGPIPPSTPAPSKDTAPAPDNLGVQPSSLETEVFREAIGPASVAFIASGGTHNMGGKWCAQLIIRNSDSPGGVGKKSDQDGGNMVSVGNKRNASSQGSQSGSIKKRYFIGRYDTESEALAIVKMAREEWNSTGYFVPRRIAPPSKSVVQAMLASDAAEKAFQLSKKDPTSRLSQGNDANISSRSELQSRRLSTTAKVPSVTPVQSTGPSAGATSISSHSTLAEMIRAQRPQSMSLQQQQQQQAQTHLQSSLPHSMIPQHHSQPQQQKGQVNHYSGPYKFPQAGYMSGQLGVPAPRATTVPGQQRDASSARPYGAPPIPMTLPGFGFPNLQMTNPQGQSGGSTKGVPMSGFPPSALYQMPVSQGQGFPQSRAHPGMVEQHSLGGRVPASSASPTLDGKYPAGTPQGYYTVPVARPYSQQQQQQQQQQQRTQPSGAVMYQQGSGGVLQGVQYPSSSASALGYTAPSLQGVAAPSNQVSSDQKGGANSSSTGGGSDKK
mmetsp:Transcript_9726/g.14658  ORF Transcript_9726/g.14658 Transcript_9726/m.14658 type:complete len:828 (+) Transcript_9726:64-2547(+)